MLNPRSVAVNSAMCSNMYSTTFAPRSLGTIAATINQVGMVSISTKSDLRRIDLAAKAPAASAGNAVYSKR